MDRSNFYTHNFSIPGIAALACAFFLVTLAPLGAQETYTVQSGDSLSRIASRHNVTVEQLRRWNNIQGDIIYAGDELIVSGSAEEAQPSTAAGQETPAGSQASPAKIPSGVIQDDLIQEMALDPNLAEYVYDVQENDSLNLLARRFDTQVKMIRWLNDMTNDTIFIGKKMLIPSAGTPRAGFGEKVTSQGPLPETEARYSVRPGDSLFSLAKEQGTTVTRLRWRNNLDNSGLKTGQVLVIPGLKEDDVTDLPPVEPEPEPEPQPEPEPTQPAPEPQPEPEPTQTAQQLQPPTPQPEPDQDEDYREMPEKMTAELEEEMARSAELHEYPHRVAPGESLEKIAQQWSSSPAVIMYLNDLSSQDLEVNRLLLVPSFRNLSSANKVGLSNRDTLNGSREELREQGTEIKVGMDESLSGLALRANTTVTRLRWLNSLNTNDIEVGDTLILP